MIFSRSLAVGDKREMGLNFRNGNGNGNWSVLFYAVSDRISVCVNVA